MLLQTSEEEQRNADYAAVDVTESLWSLDADSTSDGQKVQLLTVSLVRPPLTADEVMWKKGGLRHGRLSIHARAAQQRSKWLTSGS